MAARTRHSEGLSNGEGWKLGTSEMALLLLVFIGVLFGRTCVADSSDPLWPTYRHDGSQTGRSPLRGGLACEPKHLWSVNLGGRQEPQESVHIEDVNGDGLDEILRVQRDGILCQDLQGRQFWHATELSHPTITKMRDYAGDGTCGVLVTSNDFSSRSLYMINGRTGHKALLYTMQSVFGYRRRSGRILAGVPGEQLCHWWDGWGEIGKGQKAHGYLWSFENGLDEPTLRFEVEEDGTIFSCQQLFADMDADGRTEMVMISMEQMWLYDAMTGDRKAYFRWEPGIRTYSAIIAAEPLQPGQLPSLLMINPHIPGVQLIAQDGCGRATCLWKQVVAPAEDQYQREVKITAGAPDPFMDIDGDGQLEIMALVTNEHRDGRTHLVLFGADRGERLLDQPDLSVLAVDDLDSDGIPEVLLQDGEQLRIANWDGRKFVDRWSGEATPLLVPVPQEGNLARSTTPPPICNRTLWRESPGATGFLMRFGEDVWHCQLSANGTLRKLGRIGTHQALGNAPEPSTDLNYTWDGRLLVTSLHGSEVARFEVSQQQTYMPPPAIVGRLGNEVRVVLRDADGALLSHTPDGRRDRVLARRSPAFANTYNNISLLSQAEIRDVDGDGVNELLTTVLDAEDTPHVVAIDERGHVKFELALMESVSEVCLGVTGSLGPGQGRWIMVTYRKQLARGGEIAYDGRTGQMLWKRDSYGEDDAEFNINYPTAVYDYNGDGVDDLVVQSGNSYGILDVLTNTDLVPPVTLGPNHLPGHWVCYGRPILAHILGQVQPQVCLSRANGVTLVMNLEGQYIWHYSILPRDNMPLNREAIADLDGDGRTEIVTAHMDGLLRAFSAEPTQARCPTCLPDEPLTEHNRSGHVRWTYQIPGPINPSPYDKDHDFASADLDGDGCDEILIGSGDGRLYALKEVDGRCTVLWSMQLSSRRVGSPILADLDGDGYAEILVPTEDGWMHVLGANLMCEVF